MRLNDIVIHVRRRLQGLGQQRLVHLIYILVIFFSNLAFYIINMRIFKVFQKHTLLTYRTIEVD